MARSTFYYHLSRLNQPDKFAVLRAKVLKIYHLHKGRYGYRRITTELHNEGVVVNYKTVEKLMLQSGIKSLVRVKKYRSYRGLAGRIVPNVLQRNFAATAPYKKCATDVTEFVVCGQKQYLSSVIDLYNGEIISYTLSLIENFFGIFKSEFLYLQEFCSVESFALELSRYIHYYNNETIKSKLNGMSPVAYRVHFQQN